MKTALACIVAAVGLFFASAVHGAEDGAAAPQVKKVNGTVSQVSFVHGFLVVSSEEGYVKFDVPEGTAIARGAKRIDLDEIDPEDSVIVQYTVNEKGERTALDIRDSTWKRDY